VNILILTLKKSWPLPHILLTMAIWLLPQFNLYAEKHLSQLIMTEIQNEMTTTFSLKPADFKLKKAQPSKVIKAKDGQLVNPKVVPHNRGKDIIAQQLAANRAKIKRLHLEQKQTQLKKPKTFKGKMRALHQEAFSKLKSLKEYEKSTLSKWRKERDAFLKQIPKLKKSLINIPKDSKPIPVKLKKQLLTKKEPASYHIVKGAFENKISHQGFRPTCSAFAGVRAIEILANQKGQSLDLSEQYFYWSSKPDCHSAKCSRRGSWVTRGFDYSLQTRGKDIPLASTCEYNASDMKQNQTQIPLASSCSNGVARIRGYERLKTIDELYEQLSNNKPVILGLTLSENFFNNRGYIFSSQAKQRSNRNEHALGHAVVAVGYMDLPKKLHYQEGRVCFIVANSWGRGWGKGGYSCLSEKWVSRFRGTNSFVALTEISL